MASQILPQQFKELEKFVETWSLRTMSERYRKRLASSMAEMQAFYNAMLSQMDEIVAYLNQFPLDQLPEEAKRLLYLTLSFAEVSTSVERWKMPDLPEEYAFEAERFKILESGAVPELGVIRFPKKTTAPHTDLVR